MKDATPTSGPLGELFAKVECSGGWDICGERRGSRQTIIQLVVREADVESLDSSLAIAFCMCVPDKLGRKLQQINFGLLVGVYKKRCYKLTNYVFATLGTYSPLVFS